METGYQSVNVTQGLPFDVHIMEKRYEPKPRDLQREEARVVNVLHRIASLYVTDIPNPLKQTI